MEDRPTVRPVFPDIASLWARRRDTSPGDPGFVLAVVLAGLVLFPTSVVPTKISWALLAVSLALVANALWASAARVRATAPVILLTVAVLVGSFTVEHVSGVLDFSIGVARVALLVGLAALATACSRADRRRLVDGVLLLSAFELAVAGASAFLGVRAPWGYLGQPGSLFGVNELVTALGGRATGTLGHPIPFGMLMAVAVVLAAFAPHLRPWVRWVAALAGVVGVGLSGSRSAALVLLVALLVGALVQRRGKHAIGWRALAAVGAVLVVPALGVQDLAVVRSLEGTGSLTHRVGSFEAATRLLDRPTHEVLLGSGTDSLPYLFQAGFLQQDGFTAVDNQFVTTFATSGLVGLLAIAGALAAAALTVDRSIRPAVVVLGCMFFSFDVLLWSSSSAILAVLVGLRRDPDDAPDDATDDATDDGVGVGRERQPGR